MCVPDNRGLQLSSSRLLYTANIMKYLYAGIGLCLFSLAIHTWALIEIRRILAAQPDVVYSMPLIELDVQDRPAAAFKQYLKDFKKHYEGAELERRFKIFKHSLKEITRMNRESGAHFGLTKFSDVAPEELLGPARRRPLGTCNPNEPTTTTYYPCFDGDHSSDINYHRNKTLQDKVDWRNVEGRSFVGPVLNQKQCQACWAFGPVGVMETMAAKIRGEYGPRLSIQELIDCADFTNGCKKGNVVLALNWLCKNRYGLVTESEYPLKLVKDSCKYEEGYRPGLKLKQFWKLCKAKEVPSAEDILRLVNFHGPVTVVVNADPWLGYIDGVIQGGCVRTDKTTDHVVQIVGYDKSRDTEVPHYIVRNSWGEDFGEGGYVRLALKGNECGVRDEVVLLDVFA